MISAILVIIGFLAFCAMAYGVVSVFAGYGGGATFVVGASVLLTVIVIGVWRWANAA